MSHSGELFSLNHVGEECVHFADMTEEHLSAELNDDLEQQKEKQPLCLEWATSLLSFLSFVAGEDGPGKAVREQEDRQCHSQYLCVQVGVRAGSGAPLCVLCNPHLGLKSV